MKIQQFIAFFAALAIAESSTYLRIGRKPSKLDATSHTVVQHEQLSRREDVSAKVKLAEMHSRGCKILSGNQTPGYQFADPTMGARETVVHDPSGGASASVILLAPWASEDGWWMWMYGTDSLALFKEKNWRLLEILPRVLTSGAGVGHGACRGWYGYATDDDWYGEVPRTGDLNAAIAYVHSIIQREYSIVKDYRRIVLTGFSQGAITALEAGLSFPHPLGGVVSQRGIVLQSRLTNPAQPGGTPYVLTCGSLDDVYTERRMKRGLAFLHGKGVSAIMKTFVGLDHYGRSQHEVDFTFKAFSRTLCLNCGQSLADLENE